MEEYNKSSLVTSDLCQSCANCCQGLRYFFTDSGDLVRRHRLLAGNTVTAKRTGLQEDGKEIYCLDIKIPCSQLHEEDGKFSCKIWTSAEKPDVCKIFPSNLFIAFNERCIIDDDMLISEVKDFNCDVCPVLGKLTVEEIKRKLKKELGMHDAPPAKSD